MVQGSGCLGAATPLSTTRLKTKVAMLHVAEITSKFNVARARAQCSGSVGAVRPLLTTSSVPVPGRVTMNGKVVVAVARTKLAAQCMKDNFSALAQA